MQMLTSVVWGSLVQEKLLSGALSDELRAELAELPALTLQQLEKVPAKAEELVSQIHESWFSPFLRTLPEREIKLFLSALTPSQIKGLKHSLLLSNTLPSVSVVGKSYLQEKL